MAPAFSKIAFLGLAATASISALPVNEQPSSTSQVDWRPNGEHVLGAKQGHMGDFSSGVSRFPRPETRWQIDKKRGIRRKVAKMAKMAADYYESSASDNEDGVVSTRRSRKRADAGALTSNDDTPDMFTSHPENDMPTKKRRSTCSLKKRPGNRDTSGENIDKYGTDHLSSSDLQNTDVDWAATWRGECGKYVKCYSDDGKPHGKGSRVKKRDTDEALKQSHQIAAPLKKNPKCSNPSSTENNPK
ncbi:hypothetical protein AC579_9688 [Pseudocercospora musae]|uniref:Uncharacterized protein n=1 Tax=Pseudocercospora musae TaxID=113226 RepID=A0A139HZM4_9PEZI|nr:hypothetical protein AC579_9688 [Pseudocercospora musae]